MIPVINQIEQVASVRASAGNLRRIRPAPDSIRSHGPAEAAKSAASQVARPAPIGNDYGLRLAVNSNTHEVLVTLVNTQTNEVIRTIPGEETRRARDVIRAYAGQILDKLA